MKTTSNNSLYAVIMAGGVGSRFWPYSRQEKPKQFLDILGTGKSLLRLTYERLLLITDSDKILIVTHVDYKNLVIEAIPEISDENILLEPERKNTAPCVLYSALHIHKLDPEARMIMAPADHIIVHEMRFVEAIAQSMAFLDNHDVILTLGMKVTRPDTGYGYIHCDESNTQENEIYRVLEFVEKPDLDRAKQYMTSGNYLWNSGMFLWSVQLILNSFRRFAPELYHNFTSTPLNDVHTIYSNSANVSVDYAILEHSDQIYVNRVDLGWSDLGTWGSLYTLAAQDEEKNAIIFGKVISQDTKGCIVFNNTDQLIALQGIESTIIINTKDALLICPMDQEQKIKSLVGKIENSYGDSLT